MEAVVIFTLICIAIIIIAWIVLSPNEDNTKRVVIPRGEVLFQKRTTVVRRGNKTRIITEIIDNNDRWEI